MSQNNRDHVDHVMATAQSNSAAARSRLAASWRRSVVKHGLNPGEARATNIAGQTRLAQRLDEMDKFMTVAAPRLDRLYSLVGNSGCAVFLSDANGMVIDKRTTDADEHVFADWGLTRGAEWSEEREGTNGIGTCLAENRSLIIHRAEHFYARNTAMSCIDAPIYGPEGELVAALDVSSARADQTEGFNRLIAAQVQQTARAIEEANFRATFATARIVVAESDDAEAAVLLALDSDDLVVGATREARRVFQLGSDRLAPTPANDIFGRDDGPSGFEKAERAAVIRALARSKGNVSEAARALGIGRATLYRRMKRLGIEDR